MPSARNRVAIASAGAVSLVAALAISPVDALNFTPQQSMVMQLLPGEDTDGDGLINSVDIDDDNDGIIDRNECEYSASDTVSGLKTGNTSDPTSNIVGRDSIAPQGPFTTDNGFDFDVRLSPSPQALHEPGYDSVHIDTSTITVEFLATGTLKPAYVNDFQFYAGDLDGADHLEAFSYVNGDGTTVSFGGGDGWAGWAGSNGIVFGQPGS